MEGLSYRRAKSICSASLFDRLDIIAVVARMAFERGRFWGDGKVTLGSSVSNRKRLKFWPLRQGVRSTKSRFCVNFGVIASFAKRSLLGGYIFR